MPIFRCAAALAMLMAAMPAAAQTHAGAPPQTCGDARRVAAGGCRGDVRDHAYERWQDGSPAASFGAADAHTSLFSGRSISSVHDFGR